MNSFKPYLWRLVFTILGFITAILFMVLGFAKTFLILLCCGIGYVIGVNKDKGIQLSEWIWFWRN